MTTHISTCTYYRGDIALYAVEVTVTKGIGIHLVGLPDIQAKELLLRVVTAMQNSGYHIPGQKIVINIQHAVPVRVSDGMLKPEVCSSFDLAVALGILIASKQLPEPQFIKRDERVLFFGQLNLDGSVRLPYCGYSAEEEAVRTIIAEELDWQLRGTFDKIVVPSAYHENTLFVKSLTSLSMVRELTREELL